MKRLTFRQTIKHSDGAEHIETYCHGHRLGPAAFPKKYGTSDSGAYKDYCEMIDVIAAYEDTGLTPSEITAALAELATIKEDIKISLDLIQAEINEHYGQTKNCDFHSGVLFALGYSIGVLPKKTVDEWRNEAALKEAQGK